MSSTLLAGPIVRRATKNRVCVWIATSQPVNLRLEILNENRKILASSNPSDLKSHRITIGEKLHVYLLQARPTEALLPVDQLLRYRIIELEDNTEQSWDFRALELTYGDQEYPTFFIPDKLMQVFHGSCRKPHHYRKPRDPEHPDALGFADKLLSEHHQDLSRRPGILLLSGDQIYADDVAISLIAMLRQEGRKLAGHSEQLPLPNGATLDPTTIKIGNRKTILKNHNSGFTSDFSHNHLLSFGEFAAMYLYIFGNRVNWQPVLDWGTLKSLGLENEQKAQDVFEHERNSVNQFHESLKKIRRILANVSIYMIFDDHEVTDDWNITGSWYEKVRDSVLGRRIVSNALVAYWLFQGWGNDPDNFDKDFIYSITKHLGNEKTIPDDADRFDLYTWKHRNWGFSVPTNPPIIAIDCRTQRQPDYGYHDHNPPRLLDRYALDWLRVEWSKLKTDLNLAPDVCPIIMTAVPVMGFTSVASVKQLAVWLIGLLEGWKPIYFIEKLLKNEGVITGWIVTKLDVEATNKNGYAAFLSTLADAMRIQRCVFLSGDVHHSFAAIAWFKLAGKRLDCYQLTSSALCNKLHDQGEKLLEIGNKQTKPNYRRGFINWSYWRSEMKLLMAQNRACRVTAQCNLGLVAFDNGIPIKNIMITGDDNTEWPVYELPKFPLPD